MGGALIVGGIYRAGLSLRQLLAWQSATGAIAAAEPGGDFKRLTVEFSVAGRDPLRFSSCPTLTFRRFRLGDRIAVRYRADRPTRAIVVDYGSMLVSPLLGLALGVACLILALEIE